MATKAQFTTIPQTGKHIQFERETKDVSFFYDGEYLGGA